MKMNYLNAVFWDYPEFTDPETLHRYLREPENQRVRRWMLIRFLEHGRVVDTLQFFPLETIDRELSQLHLTPYTYKKWKRIVEVYGPLQENRNCYMQHLTMMIFSSSIKIL